MGYCSRRNLPEFEKDYSRQASLMAMSPQALNQTGLLERSNAIMRDPAGKIKNDYSFTLRSQPTIPNPPPIPQTINNYDETL